MPATDPEAETERLVARVAALGPLFRERARKAEARGRLSDDVVAFLVEHNWMICRMSLAAQPELYGSGRGFVLAAAPPAPGGTALEDGAAAESVVIDEPPGGCRSFARAPPLRVGSRPYDATPLGCASLRALTRLPPEPANRYRSAICGRSRSR